MFGRPGSVWMGDIENDVREPALGIAEEAKGFQRAVEPRRYLPASGPQKCRFAGASEAPHTYASSRSASVLVRNYPDKLHFL
jgi:hypothetical protein